MCCCRLTEPSSLLLKPPTRPSGVAWTPCHASWRLPGAAGRRQRLQRRWPGLPWHDATRTARARSSGSEGPAEVSDADQSDGSNPASRPSSSRAPAGQQPLAPGQPAPSQQQGRKGGSSSQAAIVSAPVFLATGTAGNTAMALAGIALGAWQGLDVAGQLQSAPNLPAAAACMLPLLAACYLSVKASDRFEGFRSMKRLFQASLIPQIEILPLWGLGLLALGAGVGEETLFRAFLQTAAISGITHAAPALPGMAAAAVGVAATSVAFGALHALTPTYFVFATAAGALFGVEYLAFGLPTAALTHFVYDWLALLLVLREWGSSPVAADGDS